MSHTVHPLKQGSFQLWLDTVREIVSKPTQGLSLLDLCCNECTVTSMLECKPHVAVDVVDWKTRKPVTQFLQCDALDFVVFSVKGHQFDLCICSDGIEHLTKKQGLELLRRLPGVAKLSIIFTPLGDYMVEPESTHPDKHRSGWTPDELGRLGWNTSSFPKWHASIGAGAFFAWKGSL